MSTPAAPTDIHHLEGMTDMTVIDDTIATAAPTAAGAAYRLTSVTKTYRQKGREVKALTGVDLQIEAGEFATIQGPTGGGKSTLLQMLGALDVPTSGTVLLGDTDLAAASATDLQKVRAHEIGFVFQAFNLIPTLTAAGERRHGVGTAASGRCRPSHPCRGGARARRPLRSRQPPSGGALRRAAARVAIARAIAKRPRVLLADEPTGNLDESMRDEILVVLERLSAEG